MPTLTDTPMAKAWAESTIRGCANGAPGMAKSIVARAPNEPDKMNMSSWSATSK